MDGITGHSSVNQFDKFERPFDVEEIQEQPPPELFRAFDYAGIV